MASRPDAAALAQLGAEIIQPRFFAWLDIVGDPVRATTWPVSLIPSGTGDPDLDGYEFVALDPTLVSVSQVRATVAGTSTVTAQLSGLILPDADLFAVIGDPANWRGREARLWQAVLNAAGAQQGGIWNYYTGRMTNLSIRGSAEAQVVEVEIETYLAILAPASNRTYLDQSYFDPDDRSAEASIAIANGISGNGIGLSGNAAALENARGGGSAFVDVAAQLF